MIKAKYVFLSFIIFTILGSTVSLALSPTPPLPICYIKGIIAEVEYRDAGCVGEIGQQICHPDEYLLTIEIEEVSLVERREYDAGTCEEAYAINLQQEISLPKELANANDIFEEGLRIEGEVSKPLFAKKFNSYTLEEGGIIDVTTDTCDSIGLRKNGQYCSLDKIWLPQKETDKICDNNFECSSNVCVSGECISSSLIQKIIAWFKRLFGF